MPRDLLLSVDWDYYSGCVEHTFDAPLWGSRDRDHDRLEAWLERARRRDPFAVGWGALAGDFPLYGDPTELLRYRGVPTCVALSHAEAWAWLEGHDGASIVNLDSHHDLYSGSGDPARVRPGNWAGLALRAGRVAAYTCAYPAWHAGVRVGEGFDLARTRAEVATYLPVDVRSRGRPTRGEPLPDPARVRAVLLVQSPAWTNPAHDAPFQAVARGLDAHHFGTPLDRS